MNYITMMAAEILNKYITCMHRHHKRYLAGCIGCMPWSSGQLLRRPTIQPIQWFRSNRFCILLVLLHNLSLHTPILVPAETCIFVARSRRHASSGIQFAVTAAREDHWIPIANRCTQPSQPCVLPLQEAPPGVCRNLDHPILAPSSDTGTPSMLYRPWSRYIVMHRHLIITASIPTPVSPECSGI